MTQISRLHTSPRASMIVRHGDVIYLSGQVAQDADTDVQEQTRSTLSRVEALLSEAGSSPSHILSATIYLRDTANDFAPMNEVWNAWVPDGQAPARACVQAHMARAALRVEISVIAAVID